MQKQFRLIRNLDDTNNASGSQQTQQSLVPLQQQINNQVSNPQFQQNQTPQLVQPQINQPTSQLDQNQIQQVNNNIQQPVQIEEQTIQNQENSLNTEEDQNDDFMDFGPMPFNQYLTQNSNLNNTVNKHFLARIRTGYFVDRENEQEQHDYNYQKEFKSTIMKQVEYVFDDFNDFPSKHLYKPSPEEFQFLQEIYDDQIQIHNNLSAKESYYLLGKDDISFIQNIADSNSRIIQQLKMDDPNNQEEIQALKDLTMISEQVMNQMVLKQEKQTLDLLNGQIQKNAFQLLTDGEPRCKPTLMTGLGLKGEFMQNYIRNETYCMRNIESCCTTNHLKSAQIALIKGKKQIDNLFGVFEQLLALMINQEIYQFYINYLEQNTKIHSIILNNPELTKKKMTAEKFFNLFH